MDEELHDFSVLVQHLIQWTDLFRSCLWNIEVRTNVKLITSCERDKYIWRAFIDNFSSPEDQCDVVEPTS